MVLLFAALRKAETLGRPIGSPEWLQDMAAKSGLALLPGKRGPKAGDNDHCRIESGAMIVNKDGHRRTLFPEPSQGVLASILGANVRSLTIDKAFSVTLDNGVTITAPLNEGYESVMLSVDGQSEVY